MAFRVHPVHALLCCVPVVSCTSTNAIVDTEPPVAETPQQQPLVATECESVLGFNGLGPPVEGQVRGALTIGGQGNVTNNQYSPGLFQRLAVGYGSAEFIDTRISLQINLDSEEENVDTTRHAAWFAGELRVTGPLHRTRDVAHGEERTFLWSIGASGEENSPFTEKSLLLHAGLGLRWTDGATSLTTTLGAGHYSWEADDEIPRGYYSRNREALRFHDTGLFAGIEISRRLAGGIRVSGGTVALVRHDSVVRELRTGANIEFPLPSFLGRPESLADKRVVLSGEYRTFHLDDGVLPFDEEARFQIALQTAF